MAIDKRDQTDKRLEIQMESTDLFSLKLKSLSADFYFIKNRQIS